jgi:glycosyltransferase involved in cell wall biosynthesis
MSAFARGLARRGHEVTVLTTDVLDEEHRARPLAEQLDGVTVRRFPNLSNGLAWRSKKYLPPGLVLAALREAGRFDVVHATDTRTVATAAGALAARVHRTPFCLSAHGSLPGSMGVRGTLKRAYDAALVRPMLRRASLLLAQTDHERALYLQAGGSEGSVRLLPLPVDLPKHDPPRRSGYLRRLAGLSEDDRVVLFLGRIHRLKGLDLLVGALEPLLGHSDGVHLVAVGRDDGYLDQIRREFPSAFEQGKVRFVGPIYGEARFDVYADADVFCLTPRHWEETSVAALEAGSVGTPLVVSEQADVPGLARSGGGLVVPLRLKAIRDAVSAALANSDAMGACARDLVRTRHASDAVVDKLEAHLAGVVSTRRS